MSKIPRYETRSFIWLGKSTPVAYSVISPTSRPNMTQRPLVISFFLVQPKTLHRCTNCLLKASNNLSFASCNQGLPHLLMLHDPPKVPEQDLSAMQGPQALPKALPPHTRTHFKCLPDLLFRGSMLLGTQLSSGTSYICLEHPMLMQPHPRNMRVPNWPPRTRDPSPCTQGSMDVPEDSTR